MHPCQENTETFMYLICESFRPVRKKIWRPESKRNELTHLLSQIPGKATVFEATAFGAKCLEWAGDVPERVRTGGRCVPVLHCK